jgi:hypothetical protein
VNGEKLFSTIHFSLLPNNASLALLRGLLGGEQLRVAALQHGAETLVCDAQEARRVRHAPLGIFEGEFDEARLIAQDLFLE